MNIRLEDVSVALGGGMALEQATATIEGTRFTCLLGPNGAGKTTLFRVLCGEVRAHAGTFFMGETDASALNPRRLASYFALVPQGVPDPPYLTVAELVALGRFPHRGTLRWRLNGYDREVVQTALRRCQVDGLAHRPVAELSGGEKQRAWLAFCLAQEKPFLLLDESLDALDYPTKRAFFGLLRDVATEGRGVVLITHDLALVGETADTVIVLGSGRVRYEGRPRPGLQDLLVSLHQGVSA